MGRNIEWKARIPDLDQAREIARQLGAICHGTTVQEDTYFRATGTARLKLRQTQGQPAEVIWYDRADQAAARASTYLISPAPDPNRTLAGLEATLGTIAVVHKERELWLLNGVRIHLDKVEGLGDFLEIELVLHAGDTEEEARARAESLVRAFRLSPQDLVEGSYVDLVLFG